MTYPEPVNVTGIDGLMNYAQSVSGGIFYPMAIFSLWVIVFMFLKLRSYHSADCAMAASFLTVGASFFLFLLGGIDGNQMFFPIIVLVFSVVWAYLWKSKE